MRKILLASHGKLAAGMKNSLEMVVGEQKSISALCAYVDDAPDPRDVFEREISQMAPGDELIIVTDVLGGSVNNEASQFNGLPGVYVVTGMNLAFVLNLAIGTERSADGLIDECVAGAREQLTRMSPATVFAEEDF